MFAGCLSKIYIYLTHVYVVHVKNEFFVKKL